jgi:ferredoxin-NADP reductase
MVKQLDFKASEGGATDGIQYTLLHTNRTQEELGYHQELLEIEAAHRFDFAYIASVSRPTSRDLQDPRIGRGRANNVLRYVLGMPLKEEQDLDEAGARGEDAPRLRAALEKVTAPALPRNLSAIDLRQRLDPARTVILTCGNPSVMADVKHIAESHHFHFEKEDW